MDTLQLQEMAEIEENDGLLSCVSFENKREQKLNEEGKKNLAHDIIEEMPEEEIEKFIRKWGYKK